MTRRRFLRYQDLDLPTQRLIVAHRDAQMKADSLKKALDAIQALFDEAEASAQETHAALSREWDRRGPMNSFIAGDYTLGLDPSYYGDEE